jgi:hypothetical protein
VQKSRVMALEREKSRLEGVVGRSAAEQAKAENGIGEAELRANVLPLIVGRVESVSRGRLVDDGSKQPYFLAQVIVEDVPQQVRGRLTAGMPAELVFSTGERTVLDYLVRPLKDRLNSALREK